MALGKEIVSWLIGEASERTKGLALGAKARSITRP
jgi:hypothetical protein